jgi:hypothetical protein
MPDPLPSEVVARLKSDPTKALAEALIVAAAFPDFVSWALRTLGACNREAKGNGHGEHGPRASSGYMSPQNAASRDQALLELMREPRRFLVGDPPIERSPAEHHHRDAQRLEKAGLGEHAGGANGRRLRLAPTLGLICLRRRNGRAGSNPCPASVSRATPPTAGSVTS